MLDPRIHEVWLAGAKRGSPPSPRMVMEQQYGLTVNWHHQKGFLNLLSRIDPNSPRRTLAKREAARSTGKTTIIAGMRLYYAEYIAPFMERQGIPLRAENRNLLLIGRDEPHIRNDMVAPMNRLIAECAPWLRTPRWLDFVEDPDDPNEDGVRALADMKSSGSQKWQSFRLDLANGISIRCKTYRQSARSQHVLYCDMDDILTEENFHQSGEIMDTIRGAIIPAVEPGGLLLVNGTPQGLGDYYDLIEAEGMWDCASYPAVDEDGSLGYAKENREWLGPTTALLEESHLRCLWPAKLNPSMLEAAQGDSPDSQEKYQREYLLRRTTSSSALVRHEDILAAKDPTLSYHHVAVPGIHYRGGCDPSGRKRDDAAFAVGYVTKEGVRIPAHMSALVANPHMPDGEGELSVIEELNALATRFRCLDWRVEGNGFQSIIIPLTKRMNSSIRMEKFDLGANKHTENGWRGLRTLFQSRLIRLPYRTAEDKRITDAFVHQLRGLQVIQGLVVEDPKRKNDLVSAFFLWVKATDGAIADYHFSVMPLPTPATPTFGASPLLHPDKARALQGELGKAAPPFGSAQSAMSRLAKAMSRRSRR